MAYSGDSAALKSYAENVATILRNQGYAVAITWDGPATSGPFLTNLTGSIRATKTDPKVGSITYGQGLTYDVMGLYSAATLARKIDTMWNYKAARAGSPTATTYHAPVVASVSPSSSTALHTGVVQTTVPESSVGSDTQAGTNAGGVPVSDASAEIVTGTLESQIKALAAAGGVSKLGWDQWNYYAEKVTKTPGPAPENYKLTRDAGGVVTINGQKTFSFDVWWSYTHAYYGAGSSTVGTSGGTQLPPGMPSDVDFIQKLIDLLTALLVSGARK